MENNKEVATVEHQKKGFIQWLIDLIFSKPVPLPPPQKRVVICPYCLGEIDTDYEKLEFKCSKHPEDPIEKPEEKGRLNPNCKKCQQEDMTTKARPADSIRCNAPVPEGAEKECDKSIPYIFLKPEYTVYRISLVGTTSSGKTCFKCRLNEEIKSHFSTGFFECESEEITKLEETSKLPQGTKEQDTKLFEKPDFIGFSINDKNGKKRNIILTIYDFAGEQVSGYDAKSKISRKYKRVLLASDAIFFLIDPEQNFSDHLHNPNWDPNAQLGQAQVEMVHVIQKVLTDISEEAEANPEVKTPKLAYIFSKADKKYVKQCLQDENKEFLNGNQSLKLLWDNEGKTIDTNYDTGDIPNPKEIIINLIDKHDKTYRVIFNQPPFVKNPNEIRYFISSALGMESEIGKNENGEQILTKKGPAFRVLDPLYWILCDDEVYAWENQDGNNQDGN